MEKLDHVHLSGLRAVEAVGRLGSLARAAGELGVSIGAVSQRIAKAEAALDVVLFTRGRSGMTPTAAGAAMLGPLSAGFAQLSAAVGEATRDRRDTLVVSVAPIFAARWLVWRLPRFSERHPEVKVRIDSSVGLVDPNTSDVDLCLRIGTGPYAGVRAEKLFDHRVMPVCSPDMAARLTTPEDLANVPIVRDVNTTISWETWLAPEGLSAGILGPGPEFSDGSLCFDAAAGGAGVFLAWETLDLHALASGRVVAPFARREPTGQSYWLVSAKDRSIGPAQRYFIRWMKEELAADGIELA
ncbi:LysR substrate-binding domain-containing protein [Maritimibacter sp. UBA3975]|uniref:LysR substrate-binding domain-containing protein n=1 Tax=Maritimibacter sp. UBA3975 TaxID=1946833 RepID=UPI000C094C98|nr:LysR substrate-binding domain-containing protein [Maritimibacter sp. UBA3975]MAM61891.1 LysR family transcriptional regulator [Maritimibacter sp.]|tara:strand:- start:13426 stop:14322 length:897 start_codon:yes stop_codon:yes gene_type:complete